jgi:hypothetical protein
MTRLEKYHDQLNDGLIATASEINEFAYEHGIDVTYGYRKLIPMRFNTKEDFNEYVSREDYLDAD